MNSAAFFSELTGVALHATAFTIVAFAAWLSCRRQSAARASACGRLILAITLCVIFTGAGVAWQRNRIPAGITAPVPVVTSEAPLPEPNPARESSPILTPISDETEMVRAAGDSSASVPSDRVGHWQIQPGTATSLVVLWMAGAALISLHWAFALCLRRRFVRGAVELTDESWRVLLSSVVGNRKPVRLRQHHGFAVPCAWGIFRQVILLPHDAEQWPDAKRRMVLAHECAHLLRRDSLWQALGQVFHALQWFNPFAWLILRRCRMADERSADDAVLQVAGDAPAYAELLVACARQWSAHRGLGSVTSGMAGRSTVWRRVECVLNAAADRRPAGVFWPAIWAAFCAMLAVGVILLTPQMTVALEPADKPNAAPVAPAWPAGKEPQTLEDLHQALDTMILPDLKFDEVFPDEAFHSLYEKTKINFIVRGRDNKFTADLRGTTLRSAIEAICKASRMKYEIQQRPVIIIRPVQDSANMWVQTYRIPDTFPGPLPDKDRTMTAVLRAAGIETPEGALASVDPASRRLIVKTTPEQHGRIYRFINTGKPDGPFLWHPVTLDGREYVSASEIELCHACIRHPDGGPVIGPDGRLTIGSRLFAMTMRTDDVVLTINNKRLLLTHPVIEHAEGSVARQKTLWIAQEDFTRIVEPNLPLPEAPPPGANPPPAPPPTPPAPESPAPKPPKPGGAGPGGPWNPVKIGEFEYIAAAEVAGFYEFPKQETTADGNLWMRSAKLVVRWTKDSSTILVNNVKFELERPVVEREGSLWISRYDLAHLLHPVLKPSHIKNPPQASTVIIDAGHGGEDSGAVGPNGKESDFTLDTAQRLRKKLEAAGLKVVMTRSDDSFVSRPRRVAIADAQQDAILISLHFDSNAPDKSGIGTYYATGAADGAGMTADQEDRLPASVALAAAVHANVLHKLRSADAGVKRKELELLSGTRHPAILIEGGYLSHADEGARIATPLYRDELADAVAGGVRNFLKALAAGRR